MDITVRTYGRVSPEPGERLRCAVITPVGPGHELLAEDSMESVADAYTKDAGPFSDIDIIRVDDTRGRLGRSEARNRGASEAQRRGADWIFFLDADDLMHPAAFAAMRARHRDLDAVWGLICELTPDEEGYVEREGQIRDIGRFEELLVNDPFLTLQMGHFVRTAAAVSNPFDTALDCGEDFDYYFRIWDRFRCRKVPVPLFLNRRGMRSAGPRGATDRQWRVSVERMIAARCASADLAYEFEHDGQRFRFHICNPFDLIQRHHLKGRFFELEELRFLKGRIPQGGAIIDVGANVGNHSVYFSRFLRPQRLIVFEANPQLLFVLRKNLEANGVAEADAGFLGLAVGGDERRYTLEIRDPNNLGAGRLAGSARGEIRSVALDTVILEHVDLIKIDVEGMELEVLAGAARTIERSRPCILAEAFNANIPDLEEWSRRNRYQIAKSFRYIKSVNFFLEPA